MEQDLKPVTHAGFRRVRLATWEDEHELLALCQRLHDENGLYEMSPEKVRNMLYRAFNRQGGIIGVIGAPGHIEGAVCLMIGQTWYSDEWFLDELFNYVLPEHRRSNNAKDLINFAQWCADDCGLRLLIGVLSNTRTEAKVRLYERQLGKAAGAFFVYGNRSERHNQHVTQ
jgi:GNAT superfamily N-acetyltransferase